MAELADALDSGSSGSNTVQVQVLLSAPEKMRPVERLVFFSGTVTCGASRRLRAGIPVRFAHSNVVGTWFPLTPSENAAFFGALTLRLCVPHFSTGGLSPYVAVHNPIEDLGRCHSACRDFRFHKSFPGIAKELPAARRGSPTNAPALTVPTKVFRGLPKSCSPQGHRQVCQGAVGLSGEVYPKIA